MQIDNPLQLDASTSKCIHDIYISVIECQNYNEIEKADIEVAKYTNGLPLYRDMTGYLTLTSSGEIKFFDTELNKVKLVEERDLIKLAISEAVTKYPQLYNLRKYLSMNSVLCEVCGGTGKYALFFKCGKCLGSGYVDKQ